MQRSLRWRRRRGRGHDGDLSSCRCCKALLVEGALAAEDALEVERWVAPARSACPACPGASWTGSASRASLSSLPRGKICSASKINLRSQRTSAGTGSAGRGKLRRPKSIAPRGSAACAGGGRGGAVTMVPTCPCC